MGVNERFAIQDIRSGKAIFLRPISCAKRYFLIEQNGEHYVVVYNKEIKRIEMVLDDALIDAYGLRRRVNEVKIQRKIWIERPQFDLHHPVEIPPFRKPVILGWKPLPAKPGRSVCEGDKESTPRDPGFESAKQKVIRALMHRDGDKCAYCGVQVFLRVYAREPKATADHVVPRSKGGADDMDNFVLACEKCNQEKSDRPPGEFMREIWGENLERCPHALVIDIDALGD